MKPYNISTPCFLPEINEEDMPVIKKPSTRDGVLRIFIRRIYIWYY